VAFLKTTLMLSPTSARRIGPSNPRYSSCDGRGFRVANVASGVLPIERFAIEGARCDLVQAGCTPTAVPANGSPVIMSIPSGA
jgi:hypothetical protein